jgi:hypothetical protein
MVIRTLPRERLAKPMTAAASREIRARRPGVSSPPTMITLTVFLVSRFVTSTTELTGKELLAA